MLRFLVLIFFTLITSSFLYVVLWQRQENNTQKSLNMFRVPQNLILDSTTTTFPGDIEQWKKLKSIRIEYSSISEIPDEIFNLPLLEKFSVIGAKRLSVRKLIQKLERCSTLVFLSLTSLDINELPAEIGRLTNLKELLLIGNNLSTLPSEIGNLKDLGGLNLAGNSISRFPVSIEELDKLTFISLYSNNLSKLPINFTLIPNLEIVGFDDNPDLKVRDVLIALSKYHHLNSISFRGCNITEIPAEISVFSKMEWLFLERNKISHLPKELFSLKHLKHLTLDENMIDFIPDEIELLKDLNYLSLSNNRLTRLPISMNQLKSVPLELYLEGNKFPEDEKRRIKGTFTDAFIKF